MFGMNDFIYISLVYFLIFCPLFRLTVIILQNIITRSILEYIYIYIYIYTVFAFIVAVDVTAVPSSGLFNCFDRKYNI